MNSHQLFSAALGEIGPWEVISIRFDVDEAGNRQLHLDLDFAPGSEFQSEAGEFCKAHDTSKRSWRHLNFFQHHCFLHARVPRIKTRDGVVKTVQVPWAATNKGFTLLFEAFAMSLIESEMPVSQVAALVREGDQRIWNIFHRHVRQARAKADYSGITQVGIDETSSRRGHDYVTIGVDLAQRRVFEAVEGKNAVTIAFLAEFLDQNGSPAEKVEQVSIDMSPAFIAGCADYLPNAEITFDHFHVTKIVNEALDNLRISERAECKALKGHKYTFLRNPENLSEKKKIELQNLITLYPKIGEGYRLKELFRAFWHFDDLQKAEAFLKDWCAEAYKSAIPAFAKAANSIKAHWSGILRFVESKISNGVLEGINSKVQLAKRRARGFRNKDNFISMILFVAGKLNFKHSPT